MTTIQRRKFLLSGLLCLVLILGAFLALMPAVNAHAKSSSDDPINYSNFHFDLIINNGQQEYSISAANYDMTEIVIPSEYNGKPVTEIMPYGFMMCMDLTTVHIPASVRIIGDGAFLFCDNLKNVTIATNDDEGVQEIGMDAFAYCDIKSMVIPRTVDYIGDFAFDGSEGELIVRTEEVNSGFSMFSAFSSGGLVAPAFDTFTGTVYYDNTKLGLTEVGAGEWSVSRNQGIKTSEPISIPFHIDNKKIIAIESTAFSNGEFAWIEINSCETCVGEHKINIKASAFAGVKAEKIILNNNVVIESNATGIFANATIQEIVLPNNLTAIPANTFMGCANLTTIRSSSIVNKLSDSITSIGTNAFRGCISLSKNLVTPLHLPATIATMGSNVFSLWTDQQYIKIDLTNKPTSWPDNWNGGNAIIVWKPLTLEFNSGHVDVTPNNQTINVAHGSFMQQATQQITALERPGYDFTGWFLAGNSTPIAPDYQLTGNETFTAGWKLKTHVITFNSYSPSHLTFHVVSNQPDVNYLANGGFTVNHNGTILFTIRFNNQLITPVVRVNGAVLNVDHSGVYILQNVTSAKTVKIDNIYFDIDYVLNGGSLPPNAIDYYVAGIGLSPLPTPTRTGFDFVRWVDQFNSQVTQISPWDFGNKQLFAVWQVKNYTVNLDAQGGSGTSNSITATFGQNLPSGHTPPTRTGYTFAGFFSGYNGTGNMYYDANMNPVRVWDRDNNPDWLRAHWLQDYTVTYQTNDFVSWGWKIQTAPTSVAHGSTLTFLVRVNSVYNKSTPKIYANGILLTPTGSDFIGITYTVPNVTTGQNITVDTMAVNSYSVSFEINEWISWAPGNNNPQMFMLGGQSYYSSGTWSYDGLYTYVKHGSYVSMWAYTLKKSIPAGHKLVITVNGVNQINNSLTFSPTSDIIISAKVVPI